VVEHIGTSIENSVEGGRVSVEIGNQNLNPTIRI
jgi:hypothetical protein